MLGARIDVVEAPIWHFKGIPAATARQKKWRQLWLNEIKRADWTETVTKNARICSADFLSEKVI